METFMKFDWHYSVKQWLTLFIIKLELDLVLILFLLSFYYKAPPVSRKKWAEKWLRNRMVFDLFLQFELRKTDLCSQQLRNFNFLPVCWHNLWYDCLFWGIKSFLEIGGALENKIIKKVSQRERTLIDLPWASRGS